MTSDPGDLVFDPTCGGGTTPYVAEQWGRRWITCDTSRVALTLAKRRLMGAVFDYFELAHPDDGVGSGFRYKTASHISLRSIANNPEIRAAVTLSEIDAAIARHAPQETLYDQPIIDRGKKRTTGPFTVEAVPAPAVQPLAESQAGDSDNGELAFGTGLILADDGTCPKRRDGSPRRLARRAASDRDTRQGWSEHCLLQAGAAGGHTLAACSRRDPAELSS